MACSKIVWRVAPTHLCFLTVAMSCAEVAAVLFLDDDTVRTWFRLYMEDGIEGLRGFGYEGSDGYLNVEQRQQLKSWITNTLPHTTRHVGAWIEQEFGVVYQSRSGLVALLHRLGMEHRKPQAVSQKLDVDKQKCAGFLTLPYLTTKPRHRETSILKSTISKSICAEWTNS